ncbi:MAG: sulfatase-like hydrolase/transferase [Bryobacterales bacterium]
MPHCSLFSASPNVVFIFIDDMGYGDLSLTGNRDVETQNIDRLAAQGVQLTQFYVASPICSPPRGSASLPVSSLPAG